MKRKIDYFFLYFQGFFEFRIYSFLLNCKKIARENVAGDLSLMSFSCTCNRISASLRFVIQSVLGNVYKLL